MRPLQHLEGILCVPNGRVVGYAADQLVGFWNRSCDAAIAVREGLRGNLKPGWCLVTTGGTESQGADRAFDGFSITTLQLPEGIAWQVDGASQMGAKQGLWHLLREADLRPGSVGLPKMMRLTLTPAFRQRYFMLSTPGLWNRFLSDSENRFMYQTWPSEARRGYVTALDMMGFNMIQVSDELGERYALRFRKTRRWWQHQLIDLLEHAGLLGLHRLLFIWAVSVALPELGDRPNVDFTRGYNPDDPDDRQVWIDHLEHLARYAPYLEEILTHWCDPGGFEGATIEDAQRIHLRIWRRFQREKPSIRSIFSLWMLHHYGYGRWAGYKGPDTILRGETLPTEVGLAMHGRIDEDVAKRIHASGRRCGPWVWYMADNEIFPGLHVHTRSLDDYFAALPDNIGEIVDFHGVELNCHQLNHASVYVAARKLWDPTDPADRILDEYCHLVFGPRAASALAGGYRAVAETRCRTEYGHRDVILGNVHHSTEQYIGEDPEGECEMIESVLETLKQTEIDTNWISRIPLPSTPIQMREDLMQHLEEIQRWASWRAKIHRSQENDGGEVEISDWQRPDGYLLLPEKIEVERYFRERDATT